MNHYSCFIPNLATVIEPLTKRLKEGKFKWTNRCQLAFEELKKEIVSDRILNPFNPNLPLVLATDALPTGVGAVLSHQLEDGSEKPITFISRTLTETERRYSQIDKEALAIALAIKKIFVHLFWQTFHFDH